MFRSGKGVGSASEPRVSGGWHTGAKLMDIAPFPQMLSSDKKTFARTWFERLQTTALPWTISRCRAAGGVEELTAGGTPASEPVA